MIALIKAAKDPAAAKAGLMAQTWQLGLVQQMLDKAGATI